MVGGSDGRANSQGLTLIELLLVAVILGILATMVLPQVQEARERAMIARAIGDVRALGFDVIDYELDEGVFPSSLSEVGRGGLLDPWGNAYRYVRIDGGSSGLGGVRKNRFLVPINSDFDLYSMGPDGASAQALTAKSSRDDIIRANDGGFVGEASKY